MTEEEFRFYHSKIIEICIYLEDILRRYYPLVTQDGKMKEFKKHLNKTDELPMSKLIKYYKDSNADFSFPSDFIERLDNAKEIRNFYAHQLFYCKNPIRHGRVVECYATKISADYKILCRLYEEFMMIYGGKVAVLKKKGKI